MTSLDSRSPWPSHTSASRPWRSAVRGTRADRMLTEITVSIPARIGGLAWSPPDRGTAGLLARAGAALLDLDSQHGPQLGGLGRLLVRTEAVASSRIEHVEATADDYGRALVGSRANDSAVSMVAAADALVRMVESAGAGPITERALLLAHRALMRDDPTEARWAGRYRDVQNWIGGGRSPLGADHVPPPPELVPELMADLVVFLARDDLDPIAQAAIAHAQLETIHPFTDGNGRIGRALVGAVLRRRGLTRSVVTPIATALAADRDRYFSLLDGYRAGSVDDLVAAFATAIGLVCDETALTALVIRDLPDGWRGATAGGGTREGALARLLESPVLTEAHAEAVLGATGAAVDAEIDPLIDAGLLRSVTARRRNRAWVVPDLVDELEHLTTRIASAVRGRRHHDLLRIDAA